MTNEGTPPHSWHPIDLVALKASARPQPSISGFSYPGGLTLVYGEPGTVKTWLMLIVSLEQIREGHHTLWIDFEMSEDTVKQRLLDLGTTDEEMARFLYVRPSEPIGDERILADVRGLLKTYRPTVCTIDAMAGALGLHQLNGNKADDIERFYMSVIRLLRAEGAAVHVLDHVTKDKETRGRWPTESQRKLGVADVAIAIRVLTPFGQGLTGSAELRVAKDRHGAIAQPIFAEVQLISDPDTWAISWRFDRKTSDTAAFRPTVIMGRIVEYLEGQPAPVSRTEIERQVEGKSEWVRNALNYLRVDGVTKEDMGPRGARLVALTGFNPTTPSHPVPPRPGRGEGLDPVPESGRGQMAWLSQYIDPVPKSRVLREGGNRDGVDNSSGEGESGRGEPGSNGHPRGSVEWIATCSAKELADWKKEVLDT